MTARLFYLISMLSVGTSILTFDCWCDSLQASGGARIFGSIGILRPQSAAVSGALSSQLLVTLAVSPVFDFLSSSPKMADVPGC